MRIERKQYTGEFKREAAHLMTENGVGVKQVSRDLCVARCWAQWKRQGVAE